MWHKAIWKGHPMRLQCVTINKGPDGSKIQWKWEAKWIFINSKSVSILFTVVRLQFHTGIYYTACEGKCNLRVFPLIIDLQKNRISYQYIRLSDHGILICGFVVLTRFSISAILGVLLLLFVPLFIINW